MSEISIKESQEMVDKWIKDVGFRYFNELTNLGILTEEVGEVARIMTRVYGEQSFKKSDEKYDLALELGDVMFVVICIANQTGIDLTEAFKNVISKNSTRDTERHRNNEKLK